MLLKLIVRLGLIIGAIVLAMENSTKSKYIIAILAIIGIYATVRWIWKGA